MDIQDYRWRDRIVLFICWIVLLFFSLTNWSITALSQTNAELLVGDSSQKIEAFVFMFISTAVFLFPIAYFTLEKFGYILPSSRLFRALQNPRVFWLVTFSFMCVQLILQFEDLKGNLIIDFILILLVALSVLWLFYRRKTIDIGKLILAAFVWIVFKTGSITIFQIHGTIDFFSGSWLAKGYYVLHGMIIVPSFLVPLVLLIRPDQEVKLRRILSWDVPMGLYGTAFIIGMGITFYWAWIVGSSFESELVTRLSLLVFTVVSGLFMLRININEKRPKLKGDLSISHRLYIILLSILFIVYWIFAFRIGSNNLENLNPDGLSYLIIAQKYAVGNLVVRGYWSPLLSWLVAPFIALEVNPHVGLTIVSGFSGFILVLITIGLAERFQIQKLVRLAIAATMIGVVLAYGYGLSTPDLLGAMLIAQYFYWITHPDHERYPVRYGVLIGLSGALAYYGKYYNLPFIFANIILTVLLFIAHGKRSRAVIVGILVSVAVLVVSVTPWVISLRHRYNKFTISTSGSISHAIIGPNGDYHGPNLSIHACLFTQLCDQPTDVLIPWEDPQPHYYSDYGWSPFDRIENLQYYLRVVRDNVLNWFNIMARRLGPVMSLTLIALLVSILLYWQDMNQRFRLGWILLTFILYASGYMFTYSSNIGNFRYYLPVIPILIIAVYSLLELILARANSLIDGRTSNSIFKIATVVILLLSVLRIGRGDLIKQHLETKFDTCFKYD